jgi:acetyl-CoA C-acetyltransferase
VSRAWVIAARRSAVVPRHGAFAALEPHQIAAPVLNAVLHDAGLTPDAVGELVLSNAVGPGGNPARVAALAAGWPERLAGLSLDRQCAGGLDALLLARALILSGQHDVVVAGGVESCSRRPLRHRTYPDGRAPEPYDQAPFTPWPERDPQMTAAADALAARLGIDRAAQDRWAGESHAAALAAQDRLAREIVPVAGVAADPFARSLTPRLAARARPLCGTITAANMAVAADGAAFAVLVSDRLAAAHPGAVQLSGGATLGGDPMLPGLAPVAAVRKVLDEAGLGSADLTVAEIMEAFAVQAIACQAGTGLPRGIVNPGGGALARGHPIGASGAVLAVRLFHELRGRGGRGIAAIAAAGGIATALLMRAA